MDNYVYIGKIVNTHGIKGELRLLSDFEYKTLVFIENFIIYLGKELEPAKIVTYRHHKEYEMITIDGYNNINDVLKYKGLNVYVKRDDLRLENNYLLEDLIGMQVIENNEILGNVIDIVYNKANILIKVSGKKEFYIPKNEYYIKSVDINNKVITAENAQGLII